MHHGHHHHGHHHHGEAESGDARVVAAVAINMALTLAQVVGGLLSGSLALIADALHNFSDAVALIIALVARKVARRPADAEMTFGYARAEIVAALVNYTTLVVLGLYLGYEAILRFIEPQGVDGWLVVIIAGVALAIDAATAALTYAMSRTSVNIRAAFLHNLADALGSVAVIVAGSLIILFDWRLVDPIVTLGIAGYILWMSIGEAGQVIRILMLGSPPGIDTDAVLRTIRDVDGVAGVHNSRFWQMDERHSSIDAHVVVEAGDWARADAIKASIKRALRERHGVNHSTIELELASSACDAPPVYGN